MLSCLTVSLIAPGGNASGISSSALTDGEQ
jgi:hypothetical protein